MDTQGKLIEKIRAAAVKAGSQKALAEQIGVTPQYLSDVLRGRRDPGKAILDAFGYERIYAPKGKASK